jgi:hypothetical protein
MAETTFPSGLVVRSHPFPKGFNLLKASDQELVRHGLPPRPKDPTLLSQWERVMQSLARSTFIEPEFRRTDRRHGPIIRSGTDTSKNWSGEVVFLPPSAPAGAKFLLVAGEWTVPSPAPAADDFQLYYCASWIGIDGDNSGDVLQVGVECEAQKALQEPGEVRRTIYPWWEWFPENEIQITNLAVSAGDLLRPGGDLLSCQISVTSSTSAIIILANITTQQTAAFDVTAPAGTTLVGNCAEWIVERPEVGGSLSQLAGYGSVAFQQAFGGTNLPGSDSVRDPSEGDAINMMGDQGSVLSTGNVGFRQVNCFFG